MFANKEKNFLLQQGFIDAGLSCSNKYGALQFQPRIVFAAFLTGLFVQSEWIFLLLAVLLGWSSWKPEKNPFELLYKHTLGRKPGAEQLGTAPEPRRFAQGMGGAVFFLVALCLFFNRPLWAYLLEFVMFWALLLLVTTGFCLGAVIYHWKSGHSDFIKKTLPWS